MTLHGLHTSDSSLSWWTWDWADSFCNGNSPLSCQCTFALRWYFHFCVDMMILHWADTRHFPNSKYNIISKQNIGPFESKTKYACWICCNRRSLVHHRLYTTFLETSSSYCALIRNNMYYRCVHLFGLSRYTHHQNSSWWWINTPRHQPVVQARTKLHGRRTDQDLSSMNTQNSVIGGIWRLLSTADGHDISMWRVDCEWRNLLDTVVRLKLAGAGAGGRDGNHSVWQDLC